MSYTISGSNAMQKEMIYIPALDKTEEKIKVAGYARVSSNSNDQLNSFSAQVIHYTRLIESDPKYELVGIYADEGISGVKTEKRTDFLRMMEDARNGKINRIITKSLSRFSRNMLDGVTALRELKLLGISVIFEKEGINTEKLTSENLLTLYSLLAEQESLSISKNVKKGNRARMSNGEYVSSNPPFGYKLIDKKLVIDENEAEIVRRIFKEYVSGVGIQNIGVKLRKENLNCKNGSIWKPNTIRNILTNERYIGDMLFQKSYNEETLSYKKIINHGEQTQYYVKNTHQPIVDKVVFEIANMLLNENKKLTSTDTKDYILSRKIVCAKCNKTYKRKVVNSEAIWVCRNKDINYNDCSSVRLREQEINETFINLYNKLKKNYKAILMPMISSLEKLEEKKYYKNSNLSDINKQMADLLKKNSEITSLKEKGIFTSAIFISKIDENNNKIQKLKKEKYRILHSNNENELLYKTQELIEMLENSQDYLTEMNEEIFTDIIEKIMVDDTESLKFHLINGLVLEERIAR